MSGGGQQLEMLSDDDEADFQNDARTKGRDDDFDDFDDEFSASTANAGQPSQGASGRPGAGGGLNDSQAVSNRPYDEAVELDEDEDSRPSPPPGAMGDEPAPGRAGGLGYGGAGGGSGGGGGGGADEQGVVKNQPFDEAMELSSEESVDDVPAGHDKRDGPGRPGIPEPQPSANDEEGVYGEEQEPRFGGMRGSEQSGGLRQADDDDSQDDDDDDVGPRREINAGEDDGPDDQEIAAGMYNPADFENLNVSSEIKELFQYIGRYKPHNIELETKMKPFIPDYIPAVGEIDPFVKVPRPDGQPDSLGLTVLDEPTSSQSDPVVLQLQLRAITKASSHQPVLVRSIESAEKDPKAIQTWIDSIKELHRNKPQPSVTYTKPMPDVEELMQIWPAEFEEMLDQVKLPSADIDMPLKEYAKLVCSILDIPVHNSVMEPLHLLFTLFSDFKANVHFQQQFSNPTDGQAATVAEPAGASPNVQGESETLSFE
mmetsp:Transcript_17865/g.48064  ORF Transcript_17865/g.48064 Transcript_17865/m.48064 type:complete len:485 (-) Transcript_17865:206-1660(-)